MRHGLLSRFKVVCLISFAVCIAIYSLLEPPVFAITQNDLNSLTNGTPFYDSTQQACVDATGATALTGSSNVEKAFNYLIAKGLSATAAAGIVGNLMEESFGVNPRIVEGDSTHPTAYSDTIPDYALGRLGYGIAQWTNSDRQNKLIDQAKSAGKPAGDLAVQLDFLWSEATTSYKSTLDSTKTATTVAQATETWMKGFESPDPAKSHLDIRTANAQDAYDKYHASSSSGASTACGRSTDFATNFVFYKQCAVSNWIPGLESQAEYNAATAWTNAPYGSKGNVCADGCGPSAMAMIITNLTGKRVTPDMTAAYGAAHGTAVNGGLGGSDPTLLGSVIGGHWGLKTTQITPGYDITKVNQVLRSGGLVLAGGHMISHYYQGDVKPHSDPYGPFSVGGHFVVIRAVTSDGKWLIGNPGGWPDNIEYDPAWIVAHISFSSGDDHSTWALTL